MVTRSIERLLVRTEKPLVFFQKMQNAAHPKRFFFGDLLYLAYWHRLRQETCQNMHYYSFLLTAEKYFWKIHPQIRYSSSWATCGAESSRRTLDASKLWGILQLALAKLVVSFLVEVLIKRYSWAQLETWLSGGNLSSIEWNPRFFWMKLWLLLDEPVFKRHCSIGYRILHPAQPIYKYAQLHRRMSGENNSKTPWNPWGFRQNHGFSSIKLCANDAIR